MPSFLLPNLFLLVSNFCPLECCLFFVFFLSLILLLQERTKSDKIVLDQDIFLSEFFLTHSTSFLFTIVEINLDILISRYALNFACFCQKVIHLLLKVILLVFKRLLNFIHKAAFLKQSCGWTDTVKLEWWR